MTSSSFIESTDVSEALEMETASISGCGHNTYQIIMRHTSRNRNVDTGNLKRSRNICIYVKTDMDIFLKLCVHNKS